MKAQCLSFLVLTAIASAIPAAAFAADAPPISDTALVDINGGSAVVSNSSGLAIVDVNQDSNGINQAATTVLPPTASGFDTTMLGQVVTTPTSSTFGQFPDYGPFYKALDAIDQALGSEPFYH